MLKFTKFRNILLASICLTFIVTKTFAQKDVVIDKVMAVVGNNLILKSDIENEYLQYISQGNEATETTRCLVLEELLFQKLLIYHATQDSVQISDDQVDQELNQRIRYFVAQIGSEQKLEEYYGKSIIQIKDEFEADIRKLLLARTMKGKITADIKVTPSEVRNYYNSIPKDSLPLISSELEIAQIVRIPPVSAEEKASVKEKLEKLRERVVNGEDFAALAVLYSEDPGSSKNGGELGFMSRNELVPEFAAEGFSLKPGETSKIVETQFGLHFMQLVERKGEMANLRHILLTPKISSSDLMKAQHYLDTVRFTLSKDTLSFAEAALKYSDDKETKYNGGLVVNQQTGTIRFTPEELEPLTFFTLDKLKVGEVSEPVKYQTNDNKTAYRLMMLKTRTEPHRANLKDDYQRIQNIALSDKQAKAVNEWIKKKSAATYIKIDESYEKCAFKNSWKQVSK